MGMFFSDHEFTDATANFQNTYEPFVGYVVLLWPTVESIGGYELGIAIDDPDLHVLGATGPSGWTNFGSDLNHLVGYQVPLPVAEDGTVMASVHMLYVGDQEVGIEFGPSEPASIPGHPLVADGQNPEILIPCPETNEYGPEATINRWGVPGWPGSHEITVQIVRGGEIAAIAATDNQASDAWDPLDILLPGGGEVYFPHPEWSQPGDYWRDVRAPFSPLVATKVWTFEVVTEVMDPADPQAVALELLPDDDDDPGFALRLYDRTAGITLPMWSDRTYTYLVTESEVRTFDLYLGATDDDGHDIGIASYLDELQDTGKVARTRTGASEGWDPDLDMPEPSPPPVDYVVTSFHHPDWPLGPRYRVDARPLLDGPDDTRAWPLRVESDRTGAATLVFTPSFTPNDGIGLVLRDLDTGELVNLFPSLTAEVAMSGTPRDLELLVGGTVPPDLQPAQREIEAGWSMIGLPLAPPAGADLDAVVLGDADAPAYVYGLDEAGLYEPLSGEDPAERTRGYWLAATGAFTWDMPGEVDTDPVAVTLRDGWNLVGYPLWFPGSVTGLAVWSGGQRHAWDDAVALGLVDAAVYRYVPGGGYEVTTSLAAWHGYWLRSYEEDLVLEVDWVRVMTALPARDVLQDAGSSEPGRWAIDLALHATSRPPGRVRCGAHPDATPGRDPWFDRPAPPAGPGPKPVGLAILCDDVRYRQEFTAAAATAPAWRLELLPVAAGEHVLSWQRDVWPDALDLQLRDAGTGEIVVASLRSVAEVSLPLDADPTVLMLERVVATASSDLAPARDRLDVRPNPFNPTTTMALDLARDGQVVVSVYDLRGTRVSRLDLGALPAGRHEVAWSAQDRDGRALPSGVYLAVLARDGRRVGVARMSLVR